MGRLAARLALAALLLVSLAPAAHAQAGSELEQTRRRLERIRAERERLQQQQRSIEGRVRDAGAELRNLERQRESTNRIVNELELQMRQLSSAVTDVSGELILAEDNLLEKRAVLERRLAEIYKRGPLYTFAALLSARSFGDLVSRYKYLSLQSRQDRALVTEVEQLRARVATQREELLGLERDLGRSRSERSSELERYEDLARERQRQLTQLRRTSQSTERQLTALERDEQEMAALIARLERARRAGDDVGPGSITTADLGNLDWPVQGRVVYQFGRESLESGADIRWNGIGIGTEAGTSVRAVASGRVELVSRLSSYGLTVLVAHGDGYYSFYAQLRDASVAVGDRVQKGQVIGRVGGENSSHGSHLHFEIRGQGGVALDPLSWLRRR